MTKANVTMPIGSARLGSARLGSARLGSARGIALFCHGERSSFIKNITDYCRRHGVFTPWLRLFAFSGKAVVRY